MFESCVQTSSAPLSTTEAIRQQEKLMLDYKLFAGATLQLNQNKNSSNNSSNVQQSEW